MKRRNITTWSAPRIKAPRGADHSQNKLERKIRHEAFSKEF
jgi:hypothetical protein